MSVSVASEDSPRYVAGPAGTRRITVGNVEIVLDVIASLVIETCDSGFRFRVDDGAKVGMLRSFLYWLARLMGDVNAVRNGRVRQRVKRGVASNIVGQAVRKWF